MKNKQLLTLLIAAIVLGAVAWLVNRPESATWERPGQEPVKLLPDSFDSTAVGQVIIDQGDRKITLVKGAKGWTVKERYGYAADMSKLTDLFFQVQDGKIARNLTLSESQRKDLKLDGASGGVTLTFADEKGGVLNSVVLGVPHEEQGRDAGPQNPMMMGLGGQSNGRYVLLEGKHPVLVSETFGAVDQDVTSWLHKDFFKVSELKRATLSQGGKVQWEAFREKAVDELKLAGTVPAGKEVDASKLSSVKSAFSWLSFNDVAAPNSKAAELGMDAAKVLELHDFEDFTYVVMFGKAVNGKQYLKLQSVAWNGATTRVAAKDEKPEQAAKLEAEFQKKVKDSQAKAKKLNDALTPWTYEVGTYALSSVDKTFEDFLKDKPKPKEEKKAEAKPTTQTKN